MVLFELLSQYPPFKDANDPNFEVQHDVRPTIDDKRALSPILIRELICTCWHQSPDIRPKMKEVAVFIQDAEFESLRDEISLGSTESISSVESCRICPEYESSLTSNESKILANHIKSLCNTMVPLERIMERDLDHIGTLTVSTIESSLSKGKEASINERVSFTKNMHSRQRQSLCRRSYPLNKRTPCQPNESAHDFESCSQIWLHSRTRTNQNFVNILTFIDNHNGMDVSYCWS